MESLLPARSGIQWTRQQAALPYAETGTFMAALRQEEGDAARALLKRMAALT
jgi:hypothetical protein